jgi:hypothetical protein
VVSSKQSALAKRWPRATPAVVPGTAVRAFLPPGDWSHLSDTCEMNRGLPPVARVGRTVQPKILLVGDSVGCFVGVALDEHQVADGVVTLNRSRLACPMIEAAREHEPGGVAAPTSPACVDGIGPAVAAFAPDVSVLMVGGPMVNRYDTGNGTFVGPCDPSFSRWYEAGARHSIATLSATGAPVVVVNVVHPPKFVDIGVGVAIPESYQHDVDCLNRWLRAAVAAEPHATLLDLDAYVCPGGACQSAIGGVTLRSDGRHFQNAAATLIGAWLLRHVVAIARLHPDVHSAGR